MTLTADQREKLKAEMDVFDEAVKPIADAIEPLKKAVDAVESARFMALDRYGLEETPYTCEGCLEYILPGDKYHPSRDAGSLCEGCSPTWKELQEQVDQCKADDLGEADPSYQEDVVERQEAIDAHKAAGGSMDEKILHIMEP